MIDKNGRLLFKVMIYENWLDKPEAHDNAVYPNGKSILCFKLYGGSPKVDKIKRLNKNQKYLMILKYADGDDNRLVGTPKELVLYIDTCKDDYSQDKQNIKHSQLSKTHEEDCAILSSLV